MFGKRMKGRRTAGLALLLAGVLLMGATFPGTLDASAAQVSDGALVATAEGELLPPEDAEKETPPLLRTFGAQTRNSVDGRVDLTYMRITVGGKTIYLYEGKGNGEVTNVTLAPDSQLDFFLEWKPNGIGGKKFQVGDTFTIPILESKGLELSEKVGAPIEIITTHGKKIGVGQFTYVNNVLSYTVTFSDDVGVYAEILGGTAGGWIKFSQVSSGEIIEITFKGEDKGDFTIVGEVEPPPIPSEVVKIGKGLYAPSSLGGTVSQSELVTSTRYPGQKGYGFSWRLHFLDLVRKLNGVNTTEGNVILEDTITSNQYFSNFDKRTGEMDAGFAGDAPFFLEIPLVSAADGRILNYENGPYTDPENKDGYIKAYIPASALKYIETDVAATVKNTPLSWGIYTDAENRERLIINLGKLGKDGDLTSSMISDQQNQLIYIVDDVVVGQALQAREQLELPNGDPKWETVLVNNLATLVQYWPGFKGEISKSISSVNAAMDSMAFAETLAKESHATLTKVLKNIGRDNYGEITYNMPIDGFLLRYRTMADRDAMGSQIGNSVTVTTPETVYETQKEYSYKVFGDGDGILNDDEVHFVKVDAEDHATGPLEDEVAYDHLTGLDGSLGFTFEVYQDGQTKALKFTENGNVYTRSDSDSGTVTEIKPDEYGRFTLKFTGYDTINYYLKETVPGSGYYLDGSDIPFTPGGTYSYYAISNTSRRVRLEKVDKDDSSKTLSGAEFELYKEDGTALTFTGSPGSYTYDDTGAGSKTLITGSDGALLVTGLDAETYYFKETKAPEGYILSNKEYKFTLATGLPTDLPTVPIVVVTVNNEKTPQPGGPAPKITVLKKAMDGSAVTDLDGVTFLLRNDNTPQYYKEQTTLGGRVVFELDKDNFAGTYTLKETKIPDGYTGVGAVTFTVDKDGKISAPSWSSEDNGLISWDKNLTFTIYNKKTPTPGKPEDLYVYKIDDKTGARLPGARFQLQYPDRTTSIQTTNSSGIASFPLKENYNGNYILTEIVAPSGYVANTRAVSFYLDNEYKIQLSGSYTHISAASGSVGFVVRNSRSTTLPEIPGGGSSSTPDKDRDRDRDRDDNWEWTRERTPRPTATIPDKDVPLSDLPTTTIIPDEPVPLAGPPQTGVGRGIHIAAALLAVSGLILLFSGRSEKGCHKNKKHRK